MSLKKVAVVTGSNKGIGYAIVKGLCQKFDGDVYLTARDENRGLEAVQSLNQLGLHPKFHVLDITNNESISKLRDHLQKEYGGLDVLVNNAAIAFKVNATEPFAIQAKETIRVNYFAFKSVCEILFPLLRSHARVVNLSSSAGHPSRIPGKTIREKLTCETLCESELSELMNSFVEAAEKNVHQQQGWGNSAYAVSKIGVSALTIIQQREFFKDKTRDDIIVNSVHPGFVKTDMSSHKGPMSIEEGAEAPLFAALLPENVAEPKGAYIWSDKRIVNWYEDM